MPPGAVAYFRAVGLAVEIELIGGFAHDVVELAFGAAYILSEVARRNGYPGDFTAQGEFLGRSTGSGGYIHSAIEQVVGRACHG